MKRRVLQMQVEAQQEATQLSSLGPLGFAYLKGHSNARCALPDAFAKRTCLWNTEPASVSQKADTVKVGAVVSDTKPRLRPHRVADPTLPQAVTSAPLQSVSLAPELPYNCDRTAVHRRVPADGIGHATQCTVKSAPASC